MRSLLLCMAVVVIVGCRQSTPRDPGAGVPPPGPGGSASATGVMDERFTGRITDVRFGCAVDASCDLVVDGTKYVHFGHDTRGEPPSEWGDAQSLWAVQHEGGSAVGHLVEVYAATSDHESYTLQGSRAYYIRVLGR